MIENLQYSPLFKGITFEIIEKLIGSVHHQRRQYEKDELIVQSDDECDKLMILGRGSVKGEMMDFSGKTIKIEDIEAPKPLAPAFLFGQNNRFPVNIVANEKVEMLVLPKESVLSIMQMNEQFLKNFLNNISSRTQFLSQKIKLLSFKTIKGKIAHFLLQQSKKQGDNIQLNQSQQQLADLFGVTRPSLARALGDMNQEGAILSERKNIQILNRHILSDYMMQ